MNLPGKRKKRELVHGMVFMAEHCYIPDRSLALPLGYSPKQSFSMASGMRTSRAGGGSPERRHPVIGGPTATRLRTGPPNPEGIALKGADTVAPNGAFPPERAVNTRWSGLAASPLSRRQGMSLHPFPREMMACYRELWTRGGAVPIARSAARPAEPASTARALGTDRGTKGARWLGRWNLLRASLGDGDIPQGAGEARSGDRAARGRSNWGVGPRGLGEVASTTMMTLCSRGRLAWEEPTRGLHAVKATGRGSAGGAIERHALSASRSARCQWPHTRVGSFQTLVFALRESCWTLMNLSKTSW
jgi:hypothetical protein